MKELVSAIDRVKNEVAKIDLQLQLIASHLAFTFYQKQEVRLNVPHSILILIAIMIVTNIINIVVLLTK